MGRGKLGCADTVCTVNYVYFFNSSNVEFVRKSELGKNSELLCKNP